MPLVTQSLRSKAMTQMLTLKTNTVGTSLSGPVVKNPPANAGPMIGNKRSYNNEKPVHRNERVAPTHHN